MVGVFGDFGTLTEAFMAAVDPSRWDAAMDAAAKATDSFGAVLLPVRGRTPSVPTSQSMLPTMDAYVRGEWAHKDERYRSLPVFMHRGVSCEFDFTTPEAMARSPFYQGASSPPRAGMVRRCQSRRKQRRLGFVAPAQPCPRTVLSARTRQPRRAVPPPYLRCRARPRLRLRTDGGGARRVRVEPFGGRNDRPPGRRGAAQSLRRAFARTRSADRSPPHRLLESRRDCCSRPCFARPDLAAQRRVASAAGCPTATKRSPDRRLSLPALECGP